MAFEVNETNVAALEPLFKPWEEPLRHRLPNPTPGGPALIQPGRRPSKCPLVRGIRAEVDAWRRGGYAGVSDTSRFLLQYWFHSDHEVKDRDGQTIPFRYHWAQREAIETIIYLYELRHLRSVAELLTEFGDQAIRDLALGIPPEEDRWPKNCCKIATGGGKTKVMSLAIVWSYFHRLYEPDSDLAQHFVIIAPNLTVYERLKDDFENGAIFYQDPLLPEEWKSDFQVQVVLQDEPGGTATPGAIYLTNIHRLYETRGNQDPAKEEDPATIFGPPVRRTRALDTGEALRERITRNPRLLILNDEAHHLHDPDLAWNQAIESLHRQSVSRGNGGICLQLDFTATPKHTNGELFRHIICDFPLGEAVDAGIVKVPVLGESEELVVHGDKRTPAYERFAMHLQLGYQRYQKTFEELSASRKPILFVMTEDAQSANEIADYLNSDSFPLLKDRVLNIHTRLKGKIKPVRRWGREIKEFVESETGLKPEDLKALREMSRELDAPDSKFRCVVSVLMLREGWDVRNVTTIVPLRPYSAKAGILPEQTLGRGLRRMFPPSEVKYETVVVVHHPAFRKLYEEELAQEGVDLAVLPLREVFKQTVTIFVDHGRKPVAELEIELPQVSDAIEQSAELQGLTSAEVAQYFRNHFRPLPLGQKREGPIEYKERHLFTDEIVARMQLDPGLLAHGWSAPQYFAQMLGRACRLTNPHQVLTPLIEEFLSKVLFEREVDLYSGEVDHRLRDLDVLEHIRATFAPLILQRTIRKKTRRRRGGSRRLSVWKPFQATSTVNRPAIEASRTMFNLVPCDNEFEREFADFLDQATDVAAFAKNAGPQKLMLDYLRPDGQRALYIPDFLVRRQEGDYLMVELKGREDSLVPFKARAAVEWCRAASASSQRWNYLFVPYSLFQQSAPTAIVDLQRACEPTLKQLLDEAKTRQLTLRLEEESAAQEAEDLYRQILSRASLTQAPPELASYLQQAVRLLDFAVKANFSDLSHAFQPLLRPLDEYAIQLLARRLQPGLPSEPAASRDFFNPYLEGLPEKERLLLGRYQKYLRDYFVFGRPIFKVGLLLFCLDFARGQGPTPGGIWSWVRQALSGPQFTNLFLLLKPVVEFRNTRVAHVENPLTDASEAWEALVLWCQALVRLIDLAKGEKAVKN